MERRSDKHSPRIDEQLDHDVRPMTQGAPMESRAEEEREQEGPADGEPTPDARLTGGRPTRVGPSDEEIELRAEVARHLRPSAFPARADELVECAQQEDAPQDVISLLLRLPDGVYGNFGAVWQALNLDGEGPARS